MNFLAHLWIADRVALPLAGGVLGDVVRGPVDGRFPAALAASIRLHRRIDTVTDAHPAVTELIQRFEPGPRRYAGVLLDMLFDHALARQWKDFSAEPLAAFCRRGARDVAAAGEHFTAAGGHAPVAWLFERLLRSYESPHGMDRAIRRTASRLRKPEGLIDAASGWQAHLPGIDAALSVLMRDLEAAAHAFVDAEARDSEPSP